MKLLVTVKELFDADVWAEYCEFARINPYSVNEGLLKLTDEVSITSNHPELISEWLHTIFYSIPLKEEVKSK